MPTDSRFTRIARVFGIGRGPKPVYASDTAADGSTGPVVNSEGIELWPLQLAVIHKITNLAADVKVRTDSGWFDSRPDKVRTFSAWMRKTVYYLLTQPVVDIIAVRNPQTNKIQQYIPFPSIYPTDRLRVDYQYGPDEQERVFKVKYSDILQLSSVVDEYAKEPAKIIQVAEESYWSIAQKTDRLRGVAGFKNDPANTFLGSVTDEQRAVQLADIGTNVSKLGFGVLPADLNFTAQQLLSPLDEHQKAILRQWCWWYGLPPSLMNLDLPSHTDVSYDAAYGSFIRQCLGPMLKDVFEAISNHGGFEIVADYREIEKPGDADLAETAMKLGQAGVLTINEIRNRLYGLGPIEGGDKFPETAGAPSTNGGDKGNASTEE